MTRLLVTGSRLFPSRRLVDDALDAVLADLPPGGTLILVTGACHTGADAFARRWAADRQYHGAPVVDEPHPADWSQGRRAGPNRNKAMVRLGADLCLAFTMPCGARRCPHPRPHTSHGTADCMERAKAAGIEVREVHAP